MQELLTFGRDRFDVEFWDDFIREERRLRKHRLEVLDSEIDFGLVRNRKQVEDKIPFLGDIPLLGYLFQSKYDHSVKKNLLIFVTARLVDPAGRPVGRASFSPTGESFAPAQPAGN